MLCVNPGDQIEPRTSTPGVGFLVLNKVVADELVDTPSDEKARSIREDLLLISTM